MENAADKAGMGMAEEIILEAIESDGRCRVGGSDVDGLAGKGREGRLLGRT